MPHWYLARWVGDTTNPADPHWRPPDGAVAAIDLRPLSAQGSADWLNPQGWGFFGFDATQSLAGATYYGADLAGNQNTKSKNNWRSALGITDALAGSTLIDILAETLGSKADPGSTVRAKPLLPTADGRIEIFLGTSGKAYDREFAGTADAAWPRIQLVEQDDYRAVRSRCLAAANAIESAVEGDGSRADLLIQRHAARHGLTYEAARSALAQHFRDKYKRYLGGLVRKYQRWSLARTEFIPSDLTDEGELPPETSIGDSFDRADNTNLNAVDTGKTLNGSPATWQWLEPTGDIEITSNTLRAVGASVASYARAETDLSSADHYAQGVTAIATATGTTTKQWGPCARFDSSATTNYFFQRNFTNNLSTATLTLRKTVTGTRTDLAAGTTNTAAAAEVLKVECNGTTIKGYKDAAEIASVTDSSITGGTRCGVYIFTGTLGRIAADDFEAADLGGGGTFTGTGGFTVGAATFSATATHAVPTYTASAALAAGSATLAASATFAAPVYTAAGALAVGGATLAASATFAASTYTATGALATAPATLTATATHTSPVYTATGAIAVGPATLAASAEHDAPTYTGSATLATGPATLAATASHATAIYQATAALAVGAATATGTATFAPPIYTAAGTLTVGAAMLAASAEFDAPVYTASAALAAGSATLAASATFAAGNTFTGTAALTTGAATFSGSATFVAVAAGLLVFNRVSDGAPLVFRMT